MATTTLKTRIQHKIDTASNWASSNLVPLEGELVIYKGDKPQIKVGNGSTAVGSLPFIKAGSDTTITQALTSGTEIGSISIDGVATKLYAPSTIAWSSVTSKPSYYDAKAIKSISRSGTTFTATHLDGTTSTFTQQDNNTTYNFDTGSSDGTISVNGTDVAVKGLASSAFDPLYSKRVLHDIFAFCRAATPTYEASTDGSTWTALTLDKKIFDQKDGTNSYIFQDGYNAHRWTWDSTVFSYASIRYLLVKYAYSASQPRSRLIMEAKPDSSWVTIVDTEYNANSTWKTIPVNGYSTGPIRITIQKADFTAEGSSIPLVALQCFSIRPGDQGQRIEYESPIDWDENRNILADGTVTASKFIGTYEAGSITSTDYKHFRVSRLGSDNTTYATGSLYVSQTGDSVQLQVKKNGTTTGTAIFGASFQFAGDVKLAGNTHFRPAESVTSGTTAGVRNSLCIFGTTYGNDTAYIKTAGKLSYGDPGPQIIFGTNDTLTSSQKCALIYTDHDSIGTGNSLSLVSTETSCSFIAPKVFGAVWNDYAEFRQTVPYVKPGQIVTENGDGTQCITTERLQRGCNVVSDTFGFAIGETEECKTPIACAGRALVYTYENRYDFQPGEAVCSGPNGTVSRMTREEMINNPDCIVGFVSEIPEYKVWGTGNVEVDGRIWIRVR